MKGFARRSAGLLFAALAWAAGAQVDPHRSRMDWELSSGPSEGSTHPQDVNFVRTARIRAHLFVFQKPAAEVRVQFLFFYDDVNYSGKVDGKVEVQEHEAQVAGAGDRVVASDPFRLSGKITKKGMLTGMRWVGCGTRAYEGGRLVFEQYHPATVKELAAKEPGVAAEAKSEAPAAPAEIAPPPKAPAAPPPAPTPAPAPAVASGGSGEVTVMGSAFTASEAKAALEAVNTLSEEDLDRKVGLSKTAAKNVVEARPIRSLEDLPKVKYVKTTAIAALKKYVSLEGKR
jgi:DNA uptake protein ComE-like DNA-binding protein